MHFVQAIQVNVECLSFVMNTDSVEHMQAYIHSPSMHVAMVVTMGMGWMEVQSTYTSPHFN